MGLRERERAGAVAPGREPAPRPVRRLRGLLACGLALAALAAFTTLARPQASPSSRLSIGGDPEDPGDPTPQVTETLDAGGVAGAARVPADEATEGQETGGDSRDGSRERPQAMARPLDPATLADVPATILALGPDEWTWPSQGGALLAVPDHSGNDGASVRVLDARTLQPFTTVHVDGMLNAFHGFTQGAEALILQVGRGSRQTLVRQPLDPEQRVTRVDVPAGAEFIQGRVVPLADGRVAMAVIARPPAAAEPAPAVVRVLVADLLAERLVVDLALPQVRADLLAEGPGAGPSLASPGFAWDAARERLYVAHADAPRITVVDLATGTVLAEAEVGTPLDDLGEEPVQRSRQAEVSPDGTRLYLTGSEFRPAAGASRSFGLSVIDTATLTGVAHMSTVPEWVQRSPDGRWLLWQPEGGSRAALMASDEIGTANLLGGGPVAAYPLGFSADSSHVYLARDGVSETVVSAYELPSLRRTGERRLPDGSFFDPATGLLRQGG